MNCRAASSQHSASASGNVTPWRVLWYSFAPSASVAVCTCLSVHSQSCMALASVQAPVPGRSAASRRMSVIHCWNCARNSSLVIVMESCRRCTASGPFVGRFQLRIHPLLAEETRDNPR